MGLNEKQRLLAQGLACGLTQREAYEQAGYTGSARSAEVVTSRLLLSNVEFQEYLAELRKPREDAVKGSIEWIAEKLIVNVERSMQAEPVLDREGNETGEFQYQGNVANKALELLGKWRGMFIENAPEAPKRPPPRAGTYYGKDMSGKGNG